ncbi:MAG TPA: DUF3152 domain-containing protein [Micromonosporaceae bacterium]
MASLVLLGVVLAVHYSSGATAAETTIARIEPTASPLPLAVAPPATPKRTTPAALNPLIAFALTTKYPRSGPDTFRYATTTGPVLGTAGPIRRFGVAIESNIKVQGMAAFVAKIDKTLGDPRSWVGGHQYRLQQVPQSSPHQFTIYLTTPQTTNRLCAPLPSNGYTSCRQGAKVVLNLARWMTSVPYYTKDKVVLDTYRTYMINHETGHALGHGHELCPGNGRLAPVMEQQTLGLHGCEPNPWVYVRGKKVIGPPGQY